MLRRKIQEVLAELSEPIHYKELAQFDVFKQVSSSTVAVMLSKMTKQGEVQRHGKGYYSLPVKQPKAQKAGDKGTGQTRKDEITRDTPAAPMLAKIMRQLFESKREFIEKGQINEAFQLSSRDIRRAEEVAWDFMTERLSEELSEVLMKKLDISTKSKAVLAMHQIIMTKFFTNWDFALAMLAGYYLGRIGLK